MVPFPVPQITGGLVLHMCALRLFTFLKDGSHNCNSLRDICKGLDPEKNLTKQVGRENLSP